ncbi:MAG TPA: DUF3300 domain-containing protein [Burkholderiales bacterium]|nr:DUF3300 domain-containing protein [Burkholderiales bacterium]
MKRLVALFFGLLLAFGVHAQQARTYTPAELDSMLAPIALYPDPLLTHILTASLTPFDVKAAADWSAANPNVAGDAALRAVDGELWHPSVKALVAYPDVLARMAENLQWVTDLGQAYRNQYPQLAASIQGLRSRAQATGALQSDQQQTVYQQNDAIYVQPVYPNVVYAPYYDPYLVYGTWWWPAIYPVVWRPWVPHAVFVTRIVAPVRIAHPHHHVWHPAQVMPRPAIRQPVGQIRPLNSPMPAPRAVSPHVMGPRVVPQRPASVTQFRQVPESQRAPIVHSGPVVRPAPQMRNGAVGGTGFHGGGGRFGHGGGRRG